MGCGCVVNDKRRFGAKKKIMCRQSFSLYPKEKRKAKASGRLTPIYYCIKVCKQGVYSVVHCVA